MNVYDAAHTLAKAIKNSNEYKNYSEKQKEIFSNPSTKEMVQDFRKRAMDVQIEQMSGKKVDDKINEIKKLEEILLKNPTIREYFEAELRFSQMMNDIYKILGESIQSDLQIE